MSTLHVNQEQFNFFKTASKKYSTTVVGNGACTWHSMGRELLENYLSGDKETQKIVDEMLELYVDKYCKDGKHHTPAYAQFKGKAIDKLWKPIAYTSFCHVQNFVAGKLSALKAFIKPIFNFNYRYEKKWLDLNNKKLNIKFCKKNRHLVGNILGQVMREYYNENKKEALRVSKYEYQNEYAVKDEWTEITQRPLIILDNFNCSFSIYDGKEHKAFHFDKDGINISEDKLEAIIKSISEVKNKNPLVCTPDGGLLGGHCQPVVGAEKAKFLDKLENNLKNILSFNKRIEQISNDFAVITGDPEQNSDFLKKYSEIKKENAKDKKPASNNLHDVIDQDDF